MSHNSNKYKAIALTLGTSVEPLVHTIIKFEPESVMFICTHSCLENVDIIADTCDLKRSCIDIVTIDDNPEKGFTQLVDRFYQRYRKLLDQKRVQPSEFAVDITGGRKWMSSAITMAASFLNLDMLYVHADFDNKNRPMEDTQSLVSLGNAYRQCGLFLFDRARNLFNNTFYLQSMELFSSLSKNTAFTHWSSLFGCFEMAASELEKWDLFRYNKIDTSVFMKISEELIRLSHTFDSNNDET